MNSLTDFTSEDVDKKELLDRGVSADQKLTAEEKGTTLNFPNDLDYGSFYSDVPTTVKWFLSIEESIVEGVRFNESGEIIAVKGRIPKSIVKLQGNSRKSNSHSQMVTYGPNK